jgi:hypothetical protein
MNMKYKKVQIAVSWWIVTNIYNQVIKHFAASDLQVRKHQSRLLYRQLTAWMACSIDGGSMLLWLVFNISGDSEDD